MIILSNMFGGLYEDLLVVNLHYMIDIIYVVVFLLYSCQILRKDGFLIVRKITCGKHLFQGKHSGFQHRYPVSCLKNCCQQQAGTRNLEAILQFLTSKKYRNILFQCHLSWPKHGWCITPGDEFDILGFPKIGVHPNHFNRIFQCKSSILGYPHPHLQNPPYHDIPSGKLRQLLKMAIYSGFSH